MNFPRVGLAAVTAWILYLCLGFLVHGVLLKGTYAQYVGVMRPEAQANAILPMAFAAALVGFFAFAYAYAKGYEGGPALQEGLRFGVLIAILVCAFGIVWEYMIWPVRVGLLAAWVVDLIVEFAIYGMVVGLIYRPASTISRRAAAV
jgi:hypothetical protein